MIELLVVVAIIAILASLLLPALAHAKGKARTVHCISNLKQWAMAWYMYTQDFEGKFSDGDIGAARGEWTVALRDAYEQKPDLLLCPTAQEKPVDGVWGSPTATYRTTIHDAYTGGWITSSYGANNWIYFTQKTIQKRLPGGHWGKIEQASEPTEVPLMLDCKWRGGGPGHSPDHLNGNLPLTAPSAGRDRRGDDPAFYKKYEAEIAHFTMKRHDKGINASFFDGSARKVRAYELWGLKWSRNYNRQTANFILERQRNRFWLY